MWVILGFLVTQQPGLAWGEGEREREREYKHNFLEGDKTQEGQKNGEIRRREKGVAARE